MRDMRLMLNLVRVVENFERGIETDNWHNWVQDQGTDKEIEGFSDDSNGSGNSISSWSWKET